MRYFKRIGFFSLLMDRNERHYLRFVISRLPNLLLAVCYGNSQQIFPQFWLSSFKRIVESE
jgi:hypothetical protein